jgi:hypothetical protein
VSGIRLFAEIPAGLASVSLAAGWHVAELTEGRRGQKRTFSAQKREFLTMNRKPAHRIASQPALFGAA